MQKEPAADWIQLDFEQARAKHLLFKARLRSILYGADIDEGPVVSHLECTVGKWIYGHALATYGHIPEMIELEQVHKDLHTGARRLVEMYKAGRVEEAREQLPTVQRASEQIVDFLSLIESKIQQSDRAVINNANAAPAINVNLQELQELLHLNEALDRRIGEQSQDLYEAKERFDLVAKATQDAIWDWNLLTDAIWWNKGFKELFGYSDADIEPTVISWYGRVHPDDKERVVQGIHQVIDKGGQNWSAEYRFRRKDGSYATVFDRGYALHDAEGKPYRMLGSMQDITERKEFEATLAQSAEQFLTLANSIFQLAWMADADGWVHWYNDRWYEYTGTTLEEMEGWGWQKVHHPDHRQWVVAFIKEAWQRGEPWELTFPLRRHDGVYRWFLTRVFPVRNKEGKVTRWIGTNTDIDEHKQLEALLEQRVKERTRELEMRNKELEQFTYVSHHDLQEPLRKIIIFSDMVKSDSYDHLSEAAQKRFDKIIDAARRMSTALRDVLNYASLNKEELLKPTDLDEVLATVQTDLELVITEKKARITSDELPTIRAIPQQMHQLFYNLLNNALKFSREEQPPVITVTCRVLNAQDMVKYPELDDARSYYLITVQDNGIGFKADAADKIFGMFQRLHNRDAYSGTGIGLALCKKVVMNHHGLIWAESEPGAGATFRIILPVE